MILCQNLKVIGGLKKQVMPREQILISVMLSCFILMCAYCYLDYGWNMFHVHIVKTNVGSAF